MVRTVLTRWCLTTGRGASNSREIGGRSAADKACRLGKEPMLFTSQLLKSPVGDQLLILTALHQSATLSDRLLLVKESDIT
jgi:hypothetical protein